MLLFQLHLQGLEFLVHFFEAHNILLLLFADLQLLSLLRLFGSSQGLHHEFGVLSDGGDVRGELVHGALEVREGVLVGIDDGGESFQGVAVCQGGEETLLDLELLQNVEHRLAYLAHSD